MGAAHYDFAKHTNHQPTHNGASPSRCRASALRALPPHHTLDRQIFLPHDPPTGWLWGVKPGEKPEPEGWEWPMYIFCGSIVVTAIAMAYKPDTTVSTWALEEARRRLEAEGILPDPSSSGDNKN